MKKIVQITFAFLALAFILQACSTTKTSGSASASRGNFVGTWTVTSVSYEGLVADAVQNVFDQARPADFVNSVWKLTNSGNGTYTLANGISQSIFWSFNNADKTRPMFQFKKIYEGDKAKNVAEGYQMMISDMGKANMTLKTPVAIGGATAYVVYTFTKN
jgi:hypothetical protein